MSVFVVDIEADGPAPGLYSMVSIGVVKLDRGLKERFKADLAPISEKFDQEHLDGCHLTREQTLGFGDPAQAMRDLAAWVKRHHDPATKLEIVSDNPGFDWGFLNYYMHLFLGENPLGHSARRLGDLCAGLHGQWSATSAWKSLIQTPHTHDALDDALGNAEALLALADQMGMEIAGAGPKPAKASSRP